MRRVLSIAALVLALGCGGPPGVGRDCDNNEDCASIPDGYCARAGICVATCDQAGLACDGTNGVCTDVGTLVCLQACEDDGPCGTGESCVEGACVITNPLAEP